ncbi:hypothetical protein [Pectobacterium brasiliense]|uniref:hypothetical protein n=1 Tax=Pectobacterium brasiliense TaxID=180957 RepID=UPI001968FAD1|nr:hypothetical protein [Pectobacterium brasiliense]MBN3054913.1 hypothetical protein [Pectobacterium brasiliense]
MEREYFVLSVTHTQRNSPYITLWASSDSGYRGRIESAGRYTESQIKSNLGYYNTGCDTIAVPCDVAESLSCRVQIGFFDDDIGRWLRNNRATWKALLAHVIENPSHPPQPEYRGAPRRKE